MRNSIVPPLVVVGVIMVVMFKPLIEGDKTIGYIMVGLVCLVGAITLMGAGARAIRRRRYRNRNYYRNNVDRYR
jgi:hypothetical protein